MSRTTSISRALIHPRTVIILAAASVLMASPLNSDAQTCELRSNGMCTNTGAACSPIANPDKSSASKGKCTTKVGTHPIGNTCECLGKPDASSGENGTGQPVDHDWDLVPSKFGRDPNGFLRMPNWKWASPVANPLNLADVCDDCPCKVGRWGLDAPDNQEPLWLGTQSCTHGSSTVSPPLHENSNNECAGGPAQTFGSDASGIGYHMNWEPVEYEGPLNWEGHSNWLWPQTSGDNEYSFNILRPELFLVARGRENTGVHLEFDSTETVDQWDGTGTWWDHPFHHDWVDSKKDDEIQNFLGTPFTVVIGMLGLDMAHTKHHAELHPVYAMFIRDPPQSPDVPAGEVRWSFFVRNWGSEGSCGHNQEQLWVDHIDVQLLDRKLGSVPPKVIPYRHGQDAGACPKEWQLDPNGVFRFPMASPDMKCGWVGEVTMVRSHFSLGSIVAVQSTTEEEQEVTSQTARVSKLSPGERRQLNQKISDLMKVSREHPAFGKNVPVKRLKKPLARQSSHKASRITVKTVPDPAREQQEQRKRQLVEEFLKAHGIQ